MNVKIKSVKESNHHHIHPAPVSQWQKIVLLAFRFLLGGAHVQANSDSLFIFAKYGFGSCSKTLQGRAKT